jgi:hypothetical protein
VPSLALYGQETKIFTTKDYDLEGRVKNCLVLTNYGREEFEFNRDSNLVKAVTRFNAKDYSITMYKYKNGQLVERRDEVYRDGTFDANTSMAHFFKADTLKGNMITEQILNYNKQLIDRYEYFYDEEERLSRIVRSSPEGVDETRVEYSEQEGETTTSYFLNEVLLKSIRESTRKAKDGTGHRVILTKEYIKGVPDKALEASYDANGKLLSEIYFEYSGANKTFVPGKNISYEYGERGMLKSVRTQEGGQTETKNYIFQFDSLGNWTKQIITPENAYTTRKIEYFPEPADDTDGN